MLLHTLVLYYKKIKKQSNCCSSLPKVLRVEQHSVRVGNVTTVKTEAINHYLILREQLCENPFCTSLMILVRVLQGIMITLTCFWKVFTGKKVGRLIINM